MNDDPQTDRRERYAVAIHDAMEPDLSLVDQEPAYQALIARAAEAAEAVADAEITAAASAVPVAAPPTGPAAEPVDQRVQEAVRTALAALPEGRVTDPIAATGVIAGAALAEVHRVTITVDELAHAIDNSTPYPIELDSWLCRFMAERLLEMLTVGKRAEHPVWQPEEEPPPGPQPEPEDPAELRRLADEAQQQPDTETRSDIQVWPLRRVLTEVQCGSRDWGWEEEWADLDKRHAETGYLAKLEQQIRENGITMPVLIGSDGRLWDGHHRLRLAVRIGIDYVPVEIVQSAPGPGRVADEAQQQPALALAEQAARDLAILARVRRLYESGPLGICCRHLVGAALSGPGRRVADEGRQS